jgi:potassium-transporting ATPase KdpC subunit
MTTENKAKWSLRPIIGITLISLLICGLIYPFLITGIGQALFPYQANGEIAQINGKPVGSNLIAQSFTSPVFFHPRNETASPSASGVDPDILLSDAYAQIPGVSQASGISVQALTNIVDQNQEGTLWIFGYAYVDVLRVNLELIQTYPAVYGNFTS